MECDPLPVQQSKVPAGSFTVDKERHSESYVDAVRANSCIIQDAKTLPTDESKNGFQVPAFEPLLQDHSANLTKSRDKFKYTIAEVECYGSDPFWKTLRWLLFILFWLLWILMFVATVLIVIFSPGCAPRATPKWWENAVIYQVWTPSFQDSDASGVGDFIGLTNRLENLRRLGVQIVWLSPFLHSDDFDDAVQDHLRVDPRLGINDDAYRLFDAVHDKEMKIVVSLPISITSKDHDWYRQSSQASLKGYANFSNYYHWRKTGENSPYMSKHKNAFFMHYKNRSDWPVLNWQSAAVQKNMFNIMSYWIDKGIDGFYLSGVEYLARIKSGSVADWSRIVDILRDIRDHVDTYVQKNPITKTKKIVLFAASNNRENKKVLVRSGLDLATDSEFESIGKDSQICRLTSSSIAECIHEIVTSLLQFHTENISALWEFGNPQLSRITSRVKSQQKAELLTMLQLLLPGASSVYYGDEIGMVDLPAEKSAPAQRGAMQWDNSANAGFSSATTTSIPVHPDFAENNWVKQYNSQRSQLKTFQKIARLRKRDDTLRSGHTIIGNPINSAFTVIRHVKNKNTAGNTYLGAFNFGEADTVLPIQKLNVIKNKELDRAIVIASSSNAEQYNYRQVIDLSSGTVTIPAEQGVIFKFGD